MSALFPSALVVHELTPCEHPECTPGSRGWFEAWRVPEAAPRRLCSIHASRVVLTSGCSQLRSVLLRCPTCQGGTESRAGAEHCTRCGRIVA